jgi:hypothetical protein
MADACQRIRKNRAVDSSTAREAEALVRRFDRWQNPETEVTPDEITAQARTLCKDMASLLTREFHRIESDD